MGDAGKVRFDPRGWGSFPRTLAALIFTGLAFGLVFPYRTDYLGHYLGGFGGTLLLVSATVLVPLAARQWVVVGAVISAIALGFGTESTIFKLAIFDRVDFYNQSLGAVVAGVSVLGERDGLLTGALLAGLSLAVMVAGFYFAFL